MRKNSFSMQRRFAVAALTTIACLGVGIHNGAMLNEAPVSRVIVTGTGQSCRASGESISYDEFLDVITRAHLPHRD